MKKLGKTEVTGRGFKVLTFKDHYGIECSLQASSAWIDFVGDTEIKNVELPSVIVNTRMHLNRKQVKALVKHLNNWLEKGNF